MQSAALHLAIKILGGSEFEELIALGHASHARETLGELESNFQPYLGLEHDRVSRRPPGPGLL